MADVKYKPVPHDHEAFLKRALKRKGFRKAYENVGEEYRLVPNSRVTKRSTRTVRKQAAG